MNGFGPPPLDYRHTHAPSATLDRRRYVNHDPEVLGRNWVTVQVGQPDPTSYLDFQDCGARCGTFTCTRDLHEDGLHVAGTNTGPGTGTVAHIWAEPKR